VRPSVSEAAAIQKAGVLQIEYADETALAARFQGERVAKVTRDLLAGRQAGGKQ